jgi:hypothetical protein
MRRNLSGPTREDVSTLADKYCGLDDNFMEIYTQTVGTLVDSGQLSDLTILGTSKRDACPGGIDVQPYRRVVLLDYLEVSSPCAWSKRDQHSLATPRSAHPIDGTGRCRSNRSN